ncbi:MAG: ATP-binding cassette domain-containing protein [Dongiaceae bacterium]
MGAAVLEVTDLHKSFGAVPAVRGLSLAVRPGEVFGFLGPNGAGKTSTLRMILGMMQPDAGSIRLFGAPWSLAVLPRLGYLPEERGLYRRMRAADAVAWFARLQGLDRRTARRRTAALLERLGLAAVARRRIDTLSKGMAQKLQLATALAHEPELLILDEPFSGLDPIAQEAVEAMIREQAAAGRSVLVSTHGMALAERLCDRILILRRGETAFAGSVAEARRLLPRRVRLECGRDLGFLAALPGVRALHPPAPGGETWEAVLGQGAEPGALLAACIAEGAVPTRFDAAEPSLHEVFVAVAGGDAAPDPRGTPA